MESWSVVVVVAGFVLAMALVIVLARGSTVRWERQRAVDRRHRMLRSLRRRPASARAEVPARQRSTPRRRPEPDLPRLRPHRRRGRRGGRVRRG